MDIEIQIIPAVKRSSAVVSINNYMYMVARIRTVVDTAEQWSMSNRSVGGYSHNERQLAAGPHLAWENEI